MERKETLFAYSLKELANKFSKESNYRKEDEGTIRDNLNSACKTHLGKLNPSGPGTIYKFLDLINKREITFDYLPFMIYVDHPMIKDWPEKSKRKDLFFLLGKEILDLQSQIVDVKLQKMGLGEIRFGDTRTIEEITKKMKPYINFQKRLLMIANPLSSMFKR